MNKLSLIFVLALFGVALGGVFEDSGLPKEFLANLKGLEDIDDPEPFISGRVVGGTNAAAGQIPYIASLRTLANAHFCGATILNSRWVLSAAHCTIGRAQNGINVVVGTHLRLSGGIAHRSSRIVNHAGYNSNTLANDVSVVQTATTIVTSNLVGFMALGQATVGGGVSALVSGWGQTAHPGSAPNNLQVATLTTITNADCRSRHGSNGQFVFDNVICTFTRNGQGICMGDSGGPLVAGNTVIGIPSWVIACARGFPDAYARVSSHRTWILNQMA